MASLRDYLTSLPPVGDRSRPVGLVVQGGGMRGVYSMGALARLEDEGLAGVFDFLVGSSAGGINAAYLLAGQASTAVRVYIDHLSNRNFVNPLRVARMVDIDFLVDTLKQKAPLDLKALRSSPTCLEVVVTNAETAEPEIFTNRDDSVDIYELFRATSALPALYNKKVYINGIPYVDGGTVDGVPVKRAVADGCRDIIAVLTRLPGFRRARQNLVFRTVARAMARGQSGAVKAVIGEEDTLFNEAMDILENGSDAVGDLHTWVVSPSDYDKLVGRTTFDKGRLEECAAMGRSDMGTVLSSEVAIRP